VASAALRPLQHALRLQWLDYCRNLLGLMPNHNHGFSRFQWGAGSDDVFNQRAPAGSMQNLGQAGLKPRALSRSKNNNGKIVGRHKPIILREQNQFRNASIA
jgi:hypothetical protein